MERLTIPLEIKKLSSGQFEGYGSVFGNVDHGGDVVVKGAFSKTLARHKSEGTLPQMFWMHNAALVPGKWLEMSEDQYGLRVKGQLLPTSIGKDMEILLKNDAIRGLSIGYMTEDYDYRDDGVRLLKRIELMETSLVSLAMNPLAQVTSAKSARLSDRGEYVPTPKEFERFLRDSGYARRVALAVTSKVFSRGIPDDLDDDDDITPDDLSDSESEGLAELKQMLEADIDRIELASASLMIK